MPHFRIAHLREQGQNMVIVPLDSRFGHRTGEDQDAFVTELQLRARASSYLFVSSLGHRLDAGQIHRAFYAVSRQTGLRGPSDSHGPRLHDLRHLFASKALWRWHRSGEDPQRRLPLLSAFLGHALERYVLVFECDA